MYTMANVDGGKRNGAGLGAARAALAACALYLGILGTPAAFADQAQVVTLDQAVQQALAAGPDMRSTQAALASAQAAHDAARAQNGIALDGSASLAHGSATKSDQSGSSLVPTDTGQAGLALTAPLGTRVSATGSHQILEESGDQASSLSVSASSTLWDGYAGGTALASVRQAGFALQSAQATADSGRAAAVYNVKQAYYAMLAQQRQIALLTQTVDQRQEELRRTQALLDAGQASPIDQKQATINLTSAQLDLRKAQGSLEVDREYLSALLGWPADRTYDVAETADVAVPSLDAAEAVKAALANRADMRKAALDIASAEIDAALARAKGSVAVSAGAGLDLSQKWGSGQPPSWGWSANVQVSMPILDAGAAAAAVRKVRAQQESLAAERDKLAATIAADVKDALYGLRDLRARVDLADANVELAQSQYDLARLKLAAGTGSNLDLLAASVALATAKAGAAKARADAQLGALALQSAMGM
jgi:outer membrane protein TolC